MISADDREVTALVTELGEISTASRNTVRSVLQEGASDIKKEWQANAKESSGRHGRLYPYSIDWDQVTGARSEGGQFSRDLVFEIGPNDEKSVAGGHPGQAGEGYEYGSVNQPPHLDGNRAADHLVPLIERRIGIAVEDLF